MIVADTGGLIALIDRDDKHHATLRRAFESQPEDWLLPWAILPEVDHIVTARLGRAAARCFREDLGQGLFNVEWNGAADLIRALELDALYADLDLGLVDGVVMATAERVGARAIATLDMRDFASVSLAGDPELWPRDLPGP